MVLIMLEDPNQLSMALYNGIPESGMEGEVKNIDSQHAIAKTGNKT